MEPANPSLRQTVRHAAQRLGLRAFWQWWIGQLAPLVPAGVRNAIRRQRLRPVLALDADHATLWAPGMSEGTLRYEETARVPLSGDPAAVLGAGRAAVDALPRAGYGGATAEARVVVALPASQVLRKTLTLPAAVEENLGQTLAYDIDRHTPFKPEEVYFDAVVVGRDSRRKEIRVDWAAALKTVVDQACRLVESWGAVVVAVTVESASDRASLAGTTLNLLPVERRPEASGWRRPEILIPIAFVAAFALVAAALPIWQKRGYAIELTHLAEQARVQADASNALRVQLEQLTGDYNFALERKYAFPAALEVVDDVTKLLPDDTWLTQFEVKTTGKDKDLRRELLLRGESGNAGGLIPLLEGSKLFEQAAPRSPTTKIQPGPGEIFDLGAKLKPLAPPRTLQIARGPESAAPAPAGPAAAPPAPPSPTTPAAAPVPAPPRPAGPPAAVPPAATVQPDKPPAAPAPVAAQPGKPAPPASAAPSAVPARPPGAAPAAGPTQPEIPAGMLPGKNPGDPPVPDIPDSY